MDWSCSREEKVTRVRDWGLLGSDSLELEQEEIPGPFQNIQTEPGTGIKIVNKLFRSV